VFDGAVNNLSPVPFNAPQFVAKGESVDFVVGFGADMDYTSDSTGLSAVIKGCPVDPSDVHVSIGGAVLPPRTGTAMRASFTPSSSTLGFLANQCEFQGFDWIQTITHIPDPSPFQLANGTPIPPVPPGPQVTDFPPGGYNYAESQQPPFLGANPFYYNPVYIPYSCAELRADLTCSIYILPVIGNTLNFSDNPKDPCLFGGAYAFKPLCGGARANNGEFLAFKTSLVGILANGQPSDPLYTWKWKDDFNGVGIGGVFDVAKPGSAYPVDPQTGTGGVTITSINDVPQTPPSITCNTRPNILWPPNGSTVVVTVSGTVMPGTQPLASGGAGYAVVDEYGQVQPSGSITLGAGGNYSFGVSLIATRNGNDQDGRTYTIVIGSKDAIGNLGSCSTVVTVPHDQGN
jgi:hypothetical protein